jgi:hypothetical protein
MAKPFSKAAESKLLDAAKEMTAHVESGGLSPNEAIAKVASESELPRDWLPLLVQAHNHGRTTYQRERVGASVLDKVAEFPLADVDEVKKILYPSEILTPVEEQTKTAVSAEYDKDASWAKDHYREDSLTALRSVQMEKAASAEPIPSDPVLETHKKLAKINCKALAADTAQAEVIRTKTAFLVALGELGCYFKGAGAASFQKVAHHTERLFGKSGSFAMEYVAHRNKLKLVEEAPPPDGEPVRATDEPYCLIKAAIDAGQAAMGAAREAGIAKAAYETTREEVLRPFVPSPAKAPSLTSGSPVLNWDEKQAKGLLGGLVGGMGYGLARGMRGTSEEMPSAQTPSELSTSMMSSLSDPDHEQALRQIQVKAMLSDLLANDEVISGYDPDEVMSAYNEIAAMSPRASMQTGMMRPLLRKRLTAGSVEPFEAQQMAEVEKTIAQTEQGGFGDQKAAGVLHGNPILSQ